jgi:bifunctional NMN adenylyltransferase/nudix hydrolase
MAKEFDALVFVGRFSPFHNGHKAVIDAALEKAKEVIVVVGSSFAARNTRNPFTFEERKAMIDAVYADEFNYAGAQGSIKTRRVKVVPVSDYPYDDNKWVAAVQNAVHGAISWSADPIRIGLIGHEKDGTSYYLKIFPTWGNVSVPNVSGINATDIRKIIFDLENIESWPRLVSMMPRTTIDYVGHLSLTTQFDVLHKEYKMIKKYKEAWEAAPFPPTFMTVDAVVVQSGHILLVKRGDMPGKGLWALPGGFLNQDETMLDGAIRELKE